MNIQKDLREHLEGEIHFDEIHRQVYSVDASIYEVEPLGIILPKSKQDLRQTVNISQAYNIPVIARGAATGITGGCLGKGLVIDCSKYLNNILEVNFEKQYAICQPGVVQDRLNEELAKQGYRLGPDTSTGNRATIGGMAANNAAGARSLLYGTMAEHILELELLLASGESIRFHEITEEQFEEKCALKNSEGRIYSEIKRIRSQYAEDIKKHFPNIPRRVSGYNLDVLVKPGNINLCQIIAGSEGTLGIISEIKVRICKRPAVLGLSVLHFENMFDGLRSIEKMLAFHPIALEMIDEKIINAAKHSPSIKDKLGWLTGNPQAVFIAEFEGANKEEVESKLSRFSSSFTEQQISYAAANIIDPKQMNAVWEVRKSGLGLLLSKRAYSRAIAFLEDLTVPPHQLADFMDRFCRYLKNKGKEAGIYGHVGSGCMHIRPYIDLRSGDDVRLMERMMKDIAELLLEHGGALSGEHGDGLIRSWLNKKMFGPNVYQAFTELKTAFDPHNRMNPGKIVYGPPLTENLRLTPETSQIQIDTFLDFQKEGGFTLAVDLCNGNGLCRKAEKIMCPSFQATGDEFHTTRARAQALRAIVNRRLPISEFSGEGLREVLDLCLECKGCKTECPSEVDMAKMKAEFLYHYHKKHGMSLRDSIFANIGKWNALGSKFASFINFFGRSIISKFFLSLIGISPKRTLPMLAKQRFSEWVKDHQFLPREKQVVLFNDTFTEFNEPEIGIAAVKVLEAMGYQVIVPAWQCCGRPAISKGDLELAKDQSSLLINHLLPYAKQGLNIIGLEPSCLLAIKDDYHGLQGYDDEALEAVIAKCRTFDEFIADHIDEFQTKESISKTVIVHGHCHQKALIGMSPTLKVLLALPNLKFSEIDSGCCGMAGSFGYEKEHYEISMKIGSLKLFPAINKNPEADIVADGFSCRSQIGHGTDRKAMHLAEFLVKVLKN